MKRAVSISLGSSARDKKVSIRFGNETVEIQRIGTDGDVEKAAACTSNWMGKWTLSASTE